MLARLAPKPDVPQRLDRVAEQTELAQLAPEPPRPIEDKAKLAPLRPERFALQLTIGEATEKKLRRAQALLRHQVPSGNLAEVIDRALDALLDRVEGRKLGKTRVPREVKACSNERTVPREVRRQVVARDGLRCSFVAEDGRRCEETGFLELDHVVPVSKGGRTSDGIRILCRTHNQYEAERILGREAVMAGRPGAAGYR